MKKLKVLLIHSGLDNAQIDAWGLVTGFKLSKAAYSPSFLTLVKEALPDVIVIVVEYPPEKLIADLQSLECDMPLPIVLFTQDAHPDTINRLINADIVAYIVDGFKPERLETTINIALARFKRLQTLKNALEEACAKLEDRKQIDRAKAILIKTRRFSEDEAYHTLRKLAMDRNVTLGEMAKNVIAMAELLK